MSSTAYSAEIHPDPQLRRVVLLTGLALVLLGTAAILLATAPALARVPACIVWIAASCREIVLLRRGWRRCNGVRFLENGDVEIRDDSGNWDPAKLADGSVLLRRYGWFRLIASDGSGVSELVRGSCREDRDWRRLHVIWRHV